MNLYQFRYFFSPDHTVCLWSSNDEANRRFGYPVNLEDLPISSFLRDKALKLMEHYDTSFDWDYLPGPSPWSETTTLEFHISAQELLLLFRNELGSDYEILDQSDTFKG